MKKKMMIVCGLVFLLILAILSSYHPDERSTSIKQHLVYQKEDIRKTGIKQDGHLVTHLPVMIIDTKGKAVPGAQGRSDEKLLCDYQIIDHQDKMNDTSDKPTQEGHMLVSVRGNSSRLYPKKQYSLKIVNEKGETKRSEMLGMPAHDNWTLNGSYIDHSNFRNYMLYDLSSEMMPFTPRTRLCEVMMRDAFGKLVYQGIYTLIEKPKVDENRIDLETYNPKYAQTAFLLQINSPIDHVEIPHLKPDNIDVLYPAELIYPSEDEITNASLNYVKESLLKVEKALYDSYYSGDWREVEELIDLDSFVDYYIINEYCQNYDAGRRSTYLYADLDGKLCIGPVWDFDGGLNNYLHKQMDTTWLDLKSTFYFSYLVQNPDFNVRCARRYFQLRKTVLSDDYILSYIDACKEYLGSAAYRNQALWYAHYLKQEQSNNPNVEKFVDYDTDIEKMKKYVVKRAKWLDQHFQSLLEVYS